MSRGEEENGLTLGWTLVFLFEFHICNSFGMEYGISFSPFHHFSLFREDDSILLCWYNFEFLWSFLDGKTFWDEWAHCEDFGFVIAREFCRAKVDVNTQSR